MYETTIILKSQLSDGQIAEFVDKTKKLVVAEGGEIVAEEQIGRRKLAQPIGHSQDGYYSFLKFRSGAQAVKKLNQHLKVTEDVLRSMTVKSSDKELAKPSSK